MSQSTSSGNSRKDTAKLKKPKLPYAGFPLTPHPTGKWCKKIRGKIHYFGAWARRVDGKLVRVGGDGWEEALRDYKEQADDLHDGREPRAASGGLNVAELCNHFLTAKTRKRESGELSGRMYMEYELIAKLVVKEFGNTRKIDDLRPEDFNRLRALVASKWGPVRLSNAVTRVRSIFKYGAENTLIEKTIQFGTEFKKPDKAVLRRHRAKKPKKMLEPEELRKLIEDADPADEGDDPFGLERRTGEQ
jgi:integrase